MWFNLIRMDIAYCRAVALLLCTVQQASVDVVISNRT